MSRSEFEWISRLAEILGPVGEAPDGGPAIGDDTAVLAAGGDAPWSWTVDTLVEGVHFRFDWLSAGAVGRRAMVASLSDLAAAGARPVAALVTAAGPPETFESRLEELYGGLAAAAAGAGCRVVGGDLSRAPGPLHLTVTALGRVEGGPPLGRGGARPGDEVWVSGRLGGPAAALALLADGARPGDIADDPAYRRFAEPESRGAEIAWLRERATVSAAIDLSDGLSGDADHLARRSGVGIALEPDRVPLHPGAVAAARELGVDPLEWGLHGGEEFELLLAAPEAALGPLAEAFAERFGIPLTRIGAAVEGTGVSLRTGTGIQPLEPRSWDHFAG